MNPYAEIEKNPPRQALRKLAVTFFVGFSLLAAIAWWRSRSGVALVFFASGIALASLALAPKIGRYVHIAWHALVVTIGLFTSPIVFALVFFGVVLPIGFAQRLLGRDVLGRRTKRRESYWQKVPKRREREGYFHQF